VNASWTSSKEYKDYTTLYAREQLRNYKKVLFKIIWLKIPKVSWEKSSMKCNILIKKDGPLELYQRSRLNNTKANVKALFYHSWDAWSSKFRGVGLDNRELVFEANQEVIKASMSWQCYQNILWNNPHHSKCDLDYWICLWYYCRYTDPSHDYHSHSMQGQKFSNFDWIYRSVLLWLDTLFSPRANPHSFKECMLFDWRDGQEKIEYQWRRVF
jgi:hypothetical protein